MNLYKAFIGIMVCLLPTLGYSQNSIGIVINGEAISNQEIEISLGLDQLLASKPTGLLLKLAQLNALERFVTTKAVLQEATGIEVGDARVEEELNNIKMRLGINTQEDYEKILQQYGYTDAQLRKELLQQIQLQQHIDEIQSNVSVSEEEIQWYFNLNKQKYQKEPLVQARQIVVKDKAKAEYLYREALKPKANFSALAKANSLLNPKQGGAIGAKAGSSAPSAVYKGLFPDEVGKAVFELEGPGLTRPIYVAGRFYIVRVELYLPPLEVKLADVHDDVKEDVQHLKESAVLADYIARVRANALVEFPDKSPYKYENLIVATVEDKNIFLMDILPFVFSNPNFPILAQQGMGDLALQFFLPQTLEEIINQEVTNQSLITIQQPFLGSKSDIYNQVKLWLSRDVSVTEAQIRNGYYSEGYWLPAWANVQVVEFANRQKATAFRQALLKPSKLTLLQLSQGFGGKYKNLGIRAKPDFSSVVQKAVFESTQFSKTRFGMVTPVSLEEKAYKVFVVGERLPSVLQPYEHVRGAIRQKLLESAQNAKFQEWLAKSKQDVSISNNLDTVLKQLTPPKK